MAFYLEITLYSEIKRKLSYYGALVCLKTVVLCSVANSQHSVANI